LVWLVGWYGWFRLVGWFGWSFFAKIPLNSKIWRYIAPNFQKKWIFTSFIANSTRFANSSFCEKKRFVANDVF